MIKLIRHYVATTVHKFWVAFYIISSCCALLKRALLHDLSKYKDPEKSGFAKLLPKLNATTYGSDEYYQLLDELKPVLRNHYQENKHHPEYWHPENGYARMSPLDRLEMLCDWRAATRRHDDGDLVKSIIENQERFNYNEFDKRGLLRDAEEIGLI